MKSKNRGTIHFRELNHSDRLESDRIQRLFFKSYTIEAQLVGVEDFLPLQRTKTEISRAGSVFYGAFIGDGLAAVAEIEQTDIQLANIASFAVHPGDFRRGIGSQLLAFLIRKVNHTTLTVSTAKKNLPAISFYQKHGFKLLKNWETPDGIKMVTFQRTAG